MGLKPDHWIKKMAREHGMIEPFVEQQVRERDPAPPGYYTHPTPPPAISYGVSSYGYDIRASDEFRVFTNAHCAEVNPKALDERAMVTAELHTDEYGTFAYIPPNSFMLSRSLEYIRMPRNVSGFIQCKSTYIRAGVLIPPTVLEAGWHGHIALEVANVTPLPARVYANEGLCQVIFHEGDEAPEIAYGERDGDGRYYRGQVGITLPRV
jgi:dCTP deaminase